jgi:hypothetical protein
MKVLEQSSQIDGKEYGVISAGRMNASIASGLGLALGQYTFASIRQVPVRGHTVIGYSVKETRDVFIQETMDKVNYNNEHTTTIFNQNNQPITLWNIDEANDVKDLLLKQYNDAFKYPPENEYYDLYKYGCNFMTAVGLSQMMLREILSVDQVKELWDTSKNLGYMRSDGYVWNKDSIAELALNRLGRNDIKVSFNTSETKTNGTLMAHRIEVPYNTGSHFLLGDISTPARPIYNPGNTYRERHIDDMEIRIYAK